MPTSPKTSSLAAVTHALPGPTIRSTGATPDSGQPVGERPDRLGAAGDDEPIHADEAGRAEEDRIDATVGPGRAGHDERADARDPGRDGGHEQRARVGGRPAGDIRADPIERRPATLDLDPGHDRRPGRRRPLGRRRTG